jgi:hypothetical protein
MCAKTCVEEVEYLLELGLLHVGELDRRHRVDDVVAGLAGPERGVLGQLSYDLLHEVDPEEGGLVWGKQCVSAAETFVVVQQEMKSVSYNKVIWGDQTGKIEN